mmetsp:Transcript_8941/g.22098  ORF Transcript_8941/g.22098 Transcript_8941/m.22098 type:complete len:240 (-) Transcript_8941:27-746(-)
MGRLMYIVGGLVGGYALAENKEMVTAAIISMQQISKGFATELMTVKINDTKLGEVPVLKEVLAYMSSLQLSEDGVDQGVSAARVVVRSAISTTGTMVAVGSSSSSPPPPSYASGGSSILRRMLWLAVPAAAYYIYSDPELRAQAKLYGRRAAEEANKGIVRAQGAIQDAAYREQLLKRASADLVVARRRAEELIERAKVVARKRLVECKALYQEMRARQTQGSSHHPSGSANATTATIV